MKKIRKYLIHLLGGVTEEYCDRKSYYFACVERVNAIKSVLFMMQRCYGMSADDWCKTVYKDTCESCERAEKNLKELKQQMITVKNK